MADYHEKSNYTRKQIDDAIARALPGGAIDMALQKKVNTNLLDNWYFGNAVNQRGASGVISSGAYFIDRWVHLGGNGTVTFNGGSVTLSSQAGGYCGIRQLFEAGFKTHLIGKVLTGTVLFDDGSLVSGSRRIVDGVEDLFTYFGSSNKSYINFDTRSDVLRFNAVSSGDTFSVAAVKLELGDQQTLAHQDNGVWVLNEIPDYGEQLAGCQRYFQLYSSADRRPAKAVDCRPTMRTDPAQGTVVVNSTTYYYNSADL